MVCSAMMCGQTKHGRQPRFVYATVLVYSCRIAARSLRRSQSDFGAVEEHINRSPAVRVGAATCGKLRRYTANRGKVRLSPASSGVSGVVSAHEHRVRPARRLPPMLRAVRQRRA